MAQLMHLEDWAFAFKLSCMGAPCDKKKVRLCKVAYVSVQLHSGHITRG